MKGFIRLIIVLSSIAFLSGCREDSPVNTQTDINLIFNLVETGEVITQGDGLSIISFTLSDKEGNSLAVKAASMFPFVEAGYYHIVSGPDSRLEAEVALTYKGEILDVSEGILRVTKKNYSYTIIAELRLKDGQARCTIDDKNIYFPSLSYDNPSGEITGTLEKDLTIDSKILGQQMKYSIYLPESYDGKRSYPILYILHGMGGNNNDWLGNSGNNGKMAAAAGRLVEKGGKEMIIVSPEGRNAFYCNGFENSMNYKDYFFDEFMPFIENKYKVISKKGSRVIGGLSMGGYGSLYYGLLHPELFAHVYACSPAVGIDGAPVLEDLLKNADPQELPGITIEIGTEDFLFIPNEAFTKTLEGYMTAYEYITRKGAHDWPFWTACTPKILTKASRIFN